MGGREGGREGREEGREGGREGRKYKVHMYIECLFCVFNSRSQTTHVR